MTKPFDFVAATTMITSRRPTNKRPCCLLLVKARVSIPRTIEEVDTAKAIHQIVGDRRKDPLEEANGAQRTAVNEARKRAVVSVTEMFSGALILGCRV